MRIYFPLSFSKVRATIPDRVMGGGGGLIILIFLGNFIIGVEV